MFCAAFRSQQPTILLLCLQYERPRKLEKERNSRAFRSTCAVYPCVCVFSVEERHVLVGKFSVFSKLDMHPGCRGLRDESSQTNEHNNNNNNNIQIDWYKTNLEVHAPKTAQEAHEKLQPAHTRDGVWGTTKEVVFVEDCKCTPKTYPRQCELGLCDQKPLW